MYVISGNLLFFVFITGAAVFHPFGTLPRDLELDKVNYLNFTFQ
jgi:hypothetical protein